MYLHFTYISNAGYRQKGQEKKKLINTYNTYFALLVFIHAYFTIFFGFYHKAQGLRKLLESKFDRNTYVYDVHKTIYRHAKMLHWYIALFFLQLLNWKIPKK